MKRWWNSTFYLEPTFSRPTGKRNLNNLWCKLSFCSSFQRPSIQIEGGMRSPLPWMICMESMFSFTSLLDLEPNVFLCQCVREGHMSALLLSPHTWSSPSQRSLWSYFPQPGALFQLSSCCIWDENNRLNRYVFLLTGKTTTNSFEQTKTFNNNKISQIYQVPRCI